MEIVKILHAVKAGTLSKWLESRNISLYLHLLSLNSTVFLFISCVDTIAHLYMLDFMPIRALI